MFVEMCKSGRVIIGSERVLVFVISHCEISTCLSAGKTRALSAGVQQPGREGDKSLHLVLRLRRSGAMPSFPIYLHGAHSDFTFTVLRASLRISLPIFVFPLGLQTVLRQYDVALRSVVSILGICIQDRKTRDCESSDYQIPGM